MTKTGPDNILVIKLGALGDFIQALGPMKAIRAHHPEARITLLTTTPFEQLGRDCGYFDQVWIDSKPKFYDLVGWAALSRRLNRGEFDRVYDLQNNDRTSMYFKLFRPRPEWSGIAKGASHRNTDPERKYRHAFDGHRKTLALAGVAPVEIDDLVWMESDIKRFDLPDRYAVLVPGCSPHHPEKRWPVRHFTDLAEMLEKEGITPVLIGTQAEDQTLAGIALACPHARNLCGKTDLYDIAGIARGAELVVGNDTGPMHLAAATGVPCITLFCTRKSHPVKHRPMGHKVIKLQSDDLNTILPEKVWSSFVSLSDSTTG